MDVIFSSGNGVARVDDLWFDHAPRTDMLGVIVRLSPAEEMIWSKAFIQERERFDAPTSSTCSAKQDRRSTAAAADALRRPLARAPQPSDPFGFVYPTSGRTFRRGDGRAHPPVERQPAERTERRCYGTLLSREQYVYDVERWKYATAARSLKGR